MLKDLISLANHLDQKGLRKEADRLDFIIRKMAQADDFNLTKINGIDVRDKYIYDDKIFSQIPNSGNLILTFTDSLGTIFEATVEFDKIVSTHPDDMNNIIKFNTEFSSSPAAMDYAKQQALGIYSYKNETTLDSPPMLNVDYNVFEGKSKDDPDDEDEFDSYHMYS